MTLIASIITFSKINTLEKKNVTLALDMEPSTLHKKIDSLYATRWFYADRKEKEWKIITSRTMSIFSRVCDSKAEDPFNCALF